MKKIRFKNLGFIIWIIDESYQIIKLENESIINLSLNYILRTIIILGKVRMERQRNFDSFFREIPKLSQLILNDRRSNFLISFGINEIEDS